jgi:hypothetical protein
MPEDWRVHARLGEQERAVDVMERLGAAELEQQAMERIGRHIVVSRDGPDVFLYADTEDAAREAERVVRELLEEHHQAGEVDLRRWHPDAEDWEPVEEPLPQTEEERQAERAELMEREAYESETQGYTDWEVQVHLPSHRAAVELADRLEAEGLEPSRRWRWVIVPARSEEAATELAIRLRDEAPEGSKVGVEGTLDSVRAGASNPFAFLGGLGN